MHASSSVLLSQLEGSPGGEVIIETVEAAAADVAAVAAEVAAATVVAAVTAGVVSDVAAGREAELVGTTVVASSPSGSVLGRQFHSSKTH